MHNTILPQNKQLKELRLDFLERIERCEIASVAIVACQGDHIFWQEGLGWADYDRRIKTTPHHLYPVASLSKSMTATGVMVLVERGLVALDEPVGPYLAPATLTAYEGRTEDVTVRSVLNMTAGIPHGWLHYNDGRVLSPSEFVNRFGMVVTPPGQFDLYSNFSYGVAEAIITNVSGQSYTDFMRTEVFQPLGMAHTSVHIGPGLSSLVVNKYEANDTLIGHIPFVPLGAAGCYASVHDLWRYGHFHLNNPLPDQKMVLHEETLDLMHTADGDSIIGLGWGSVEITPGLRWLISNGHIAGANSMLTLIPEENIVIAVLLNHSMALADEIAIQITEAILPGFAEKAIAVISDYEKQQNLPPYQPTHQLTGNWQGKIQTDVGSISCRLIAEETVQIRLGEQPQVSLNEVRFGNNKLQGSFRGNLPNAENFQGEQDISIDLRWQPGKLSGTATATFQTDNGLFCLPTYVQLTRQSAS